MNSTQLMMSFAVFFLIPGLLQRVKKGVVRNVDRVLVFVPIIIWLMWLGLTAVSGDYNVFFWMSFVLIVINVIAAGFNTERIMISTKGWEQLPETLFHSLTAQGISMEVQTVVNSKDKIRKKLTLENHKAVITYDCSRPRFLKTGDFTLTIKNGRGDKAVKEAVNQMIRTNHDNFKYTGSFNEYYSYVWGIGLVLMSVFLMRH